MGCITIHLCYGKQGSKSFNFPFVALIFAGLFFMSLTIRDPHAKIKGIKVLARCQVNVYRVCGVFHPISFLEK